MPHDVMRAFEPRLAELIGLHGENAVDHEWFKGPIYSQPYLGGPAGSTSGEGVQF